MGESEVYETGYDANFNVEPPDYLKCVICSLVLRDPVMTVDCGHRFCKGCYEKMKTFAKTANLPLQCPHDRTEIDAGKVVEDKGTARVALDLKVKCNKFEEGCEWTGDLRDLKVHMYNDCKKLDVRLLVFKLTERLGDCEKRLNDKDSEISKLHTELKTAKEGKKNVNKRLAKCEELLAERGQQIETMTKYLKSEVEQVKESIINAMNESKEKYEQAKKNAKKESKKSKKQQEKTIIGSEESIEPPSLMSLEVTPLVGPSPKPKQTKKNAKKRANQAKKERKIKKVNLHDGSTITNDNDSTVLEWRISDYAAKEALEETIYSPTFNTGLAGFPCRFALNWNGKQKGRLSIFLLVVGRVCTSSNPFEITFAVLDESGGPYKVSMIGKNVQPTKLTIKPCGTELEGFGDENLPALRNYVIHDVLIVKCILSRDVEQSMSMFHEVVGAPQPSMDEPKDIKVVTGRKIVHVQATDLTSTDIPQAPQMPSPTHLPPSTQLPPPTQLPPSTQLPPPT